MCEILGRMLSSVRPWFGRIGRVTTESSRNIGRGPPNKTTKPVHVRVHSDKTTVYNPTPYMLVRNIVIHNCSVQKDRILRTPCPVDMYCLPRSYRGVYSVHATEQNIIFQRSSRERLPLPLIILSPLSPPLRLSFRFVAIRQSYTTLFRTDNTPSPKS